MPFWSWELACRQIKKPSATAEGFSESLPQFQCDLLAATEQGTDADQSSTERARLGDIDADAADLLFDDES